MVPRDGMKGRLYLCRLILEDVIYFGVQFVRDLIDEFEIASLGLRSCLLEFFVVVQILLHRGFNNCRI